MILSECTENVNRLIVKTHSINVSLVVVYRQPTACVNKFTEIFESILKNYRRTIIIGDMNINLLSINNNITENYRSAIYENGFFILNKIDPIAATRAATRTYSNRQSSSNTIIDHAVSDLVDFEFTISLTDASVSDHKLIMISFDDKTDRSANFRNERGNYQLKIIDEDKYTQNLNETCSDNINSFEILIEKLNLIKNNSLKIITREKCINPHKPWLNGELLQIIHERNRYFRLLKVSPTNTYLKFKYSQLSANATQLKKRLRSSFNSAKINNLTNNPKKMWSAINEIISNKTGKSNQIQSMKLGNGTITTEPKRIADECNIFLKDVGFSLYNAIPVNTNMLLKMGNSPTDFISSKMLKNTANN